MTSSAKTCAVMFADLTMLSRVGNQSFFYSLWNGFFPNHNFLFIIGIFGKILYKHFLFVPGLDDLECGLNDGMHQDQRRLEKEDLHDIPEDAQGIKRVATTIRQCAFFSSRWLSL
jgi:hypothetical protein